MTDVIKCKDCKYLERWRTPERSEQFSYLNVCGKYVISTPSPDDYCSKAERKEEKHSDNRWCNTCEFKHIESECLGCAEYDEHGNLINLRNYKKEESDG